MAQGSTVSSSLPAAALEDDLTEEETLEDGEFQDDPDDEAARAEGYASAAEKDAMEAEARGQGWRPLAEYRGKPGGWKTAKAFIEAGQNYLPFVQKENRELKQSLANMTNEIEGMRTEVTSTRTEMQKLLDFSRRANQAGYDRAVKDLKQQQREAVASGDTATYDKIEGQLDEMAAAREDAGTSEPPAPTPKPAPKPEPAVKIQQEYKDFLDENPWYARDSVLNSAMIAEHNAVIEEFPGMSLADQLQRAKEMVMARFPRKFGITEPNQEPAPRQQRRPAAPLAPSQGNRRPTPSGRTGIEAIEDPRERAEAKQGYAAAKRSMPGLTEAEYLEIFNDPHSDVLDVIERNKPRSKSNGR